VNNPQPILRHIDTYSEFLAIAGEWNNLVEQIEEKSVFLRHEWFDAAWQWRQHSGELQILTIYQSDALIGICPLMKDHLPQFKMRLKRIQFLTIPDTQFCDIIAHDKDKPLVIETFGRWLNNPEHKWDILDLSYLPATSITCELLPAALEKNNIDNHLQQVEQNPYIDLEANWESFYSTCSRRLKKGNNLIRNRLQKEGEIHIVQARDPEHVRQALDVLKTLSAKSWKQTTNTTFDNEAPKSFIERLTTHAEKNNWASIWLLYLNDKPLAAEYQLIYNNEIFALRADFDETASELSPGSYLNWKLLESLFGHKQKRYYMGPGKNAYKKRWSKLSIPIVRINGFNKTIRGRMSIFIERYLRPVKHKLAQHNKTCTPAKKA